MPEGYYREAIYANRGELWLDQAARDNMLVVCRCRACRRLVRYLATDLLPLLGPDHRVMVKPPFRCRCGQADRIDIQVISPMPGDWEVSRYGGRRASAERSCGGR